MSDGVLETLGVPPAVGRWFSAADQIPHSRQTVVLGYAYWQRRFGGNRSVIGRNIRIDSVLREVVGVMPRGFRLADASFDIITPLAFDRANLILGDFSFHGVGRLRRGVTIAQADADLARLLPVWMDSWSNGPGTDPHFYERWRIAPAIRPLKEEEIGNVASVLWTVMATIGIVMLIACANVTSLLMVRAEARQQELALRAAIGGSPVQIVRGLLVESVLLGCAGGALGVWFAFGGLRLLAAIGPADLPRLNEIALDARSLSFAFLLSLASGLLFGLIPALRYAVPRIAFTLRGGGRMVTAGRQTHRTRSILAVAQIAMALVLLVCAGLMIRTFAALRAVNPGFTDPAHLQLVRIALPPEMAHGIRMQNDILDSLAAIPGVTSAGFASEMPMENYGSGWDRIFARNKAEQRGETLPLGLFESISPGLLHAAGTTLLAGRDFTWTDVYGNRPVVMVSENLARALWGSASAALGKRICAGQPGPDWREVVGVVQDVRQNGLQAPAPATVYWPRPTSYATFAVRTARAGSAGLLKDLGRAVWSVNAGVALASVRTMKDVVDRSLARTSFTLVMLGIAATMALALGVIGIYGTISYAVSQRTREIGIRLALGAQQGALSWSFVTFGLALAGAGVAIGLAAALGLTRLMKSLLFGIGPLDPVTYVLAALLLAAAAVIASYLPARRAASVDPVEALKAE